MSSQPSSTEVVAKSGPTKTSGRDLRRLAAVAVVGAGLVGLGLADYSAPAVAQFKPGTPAETLSFADIVDRVKPAVVSITTKMRPAQVAADEGPIADDARYYFPPRFLIPCASIWTLKTVPPPTTYSVFISGPAKARFCGLRDGVMEPRYAPCGVNT